MPHKKKLSFIKNIWNCVPEFIRNLYTDLYMIILRVWKLLISTAFEAMRKINCERLLRRHVCRQTFARCTRRWHLTSTSNKTDSSHALLDAGDFRDFNLRDERRRARPLNKRRREDCAKNDDESDACISRDGLKRNAA